MEGIGAAVSEYGFPIVSAVGLLYMIYYIWNFITNNIKAKLAEANTTLKALIDRIRMLDNDIIRLQQKLARFSKIPRGQWASFFPQQLPAEFVER